MAYATLSSCSNGCVLKVFFNDHWTGEIFFDLLNHSEIEENQLQWRHLAEIKKNDL